MHWYENPAVAAILGAVAGALVSGLVSVYIWRRTRTLRRVDCVVTDAVSLLSFSEQVKNQLKITFSGIPVQSLYLMSVDVINTGTVAITQQPVNIRLADGARIIEYSLTTEPPVAFGEISETEHREHRLGLQIHLMNPGDKVSIELLSLDNPDATLNVYLKNMDVQTRVYSRKAAERTVLDLMNDSHVMWLAVLGAVPLFGGIARSLIDVAVAKRIGKLRDSRSIQEDS